MKNIIKFLRGDYNFENETLNVILFAVIFMIMIINLVMICFVPAYRAIWCAVSLLGAAKEIYDFIEED